MYDTRLGRWISEDPLGLGPDENPSRFVRNQPVLLTDPSGLIPPGSENWGNEGIYSSLNHTLHRMTFKVKTNGLCDDEKDVNQRANEIADDIYDKLKGFSLFNDGHNTIAKVDLRTENGDTFADFTAFGLLGLGNRLIGQYTVPVKLTNDDTSREITGRTLGNHMLVGVRKWRVRVEEDIVTVETESWDRPATSLNTVGMTLLGASSQLGIWSQYFANIKEYVRDNYWTETTFDPLNSIMNGFHECRKGENPWKREFRPVDK